ncbi:MAG: glutaredoxin domain-containing protein [Fluviibacter sp.]
MLVTIYSLPVSVCVKCRAVEISMRRKGIETVKVLVDQDSEALEYIKSLGYTEAPVIVVTDDGEVVDHWSGFSEEKINALRELVAA